MQPSLDAISAHSIFIPPEASSQSLEGWELIDTPASAGPSVSRKLKRMVTRDHDLIVAFGREIRTTNLTKGSWTVKDDRIGEYKVLKTNGIDFDICQLCVNPTGRLLAVVGKGQVTVVVLPRSSQVGTSAGSIECRAMRIEEFEFSLSSTKTIAQVAWHPYGQDGCSLWILTSDGTLREYDVSRPDDPTQTFNFLPQPSPSTSRFTAVDPLSLSAASFAFYPGTEGFGATMVYVLAENGDLYLMGPIMPLRAELPMSWLQQVKSLSEEIGGVCADWVELLIKQSREEKEQSKEEDDSLSLSRRTSTLSDDRQFGTPQPTRTSRKDGLVRLHPPHLSKSGGPAPGVHRPLLRRGPIIFSPGPQVENETEDDEEDEAASDLLMMENESSGSVIFAIAWSTGRVDIGLVADPPLPRWNSSKDITPVNISLPIIESIALQNEDSNDDPSSSLPCLIADGIEDDKFYVQSERGIESILMYPWLDELKEEFDALPPSTVSVMVKGESSSSETIVGVTTVEGLHVPHSLLALTSSGRLAVKETDDSDGPLDEFRSSLLREASIIPEQNRSLLAAKRLDFDKLLAFVRRSVDLRMPTQAVFQGKPIQTVNADQLRKVADVIKVLQERAQAIRSASGALENHLDLCIQESQRQIRALKECRDNIDAMRDSKSGPRVVRLLDKQVVTAKKLDQVVESMVEKFKPEVGDAEQKWFDELGRLSAKVRHGQSSMVNRASSLQEKVATLRPSLVALKDSSDGPNEAYGDKQLQPIERALDQRAKEIQELLKRMDKLSVNIERDEAASGGA